MEALELPEGARDAYLRSRPPADAALCEEVLKLLKAHSSAGAFLEKGISPTQVMSLVKNHRPADLAPGTAIGDFEIERTLGSGGFGTVYLATQISLGRQVALKVTSNQGREAQVLAALDHDNIVKVFSESVDAARNVKILCMQYVTGTDLNKLYEKKKVSGLNGLDGNAVLALVKPTGEAENSFNPTLIAEQDRVRRLDAIQFVMWFGAKIADALSYAHGCGVLHLDLKPGNILITPFGRPLLVDFNISLGNNPSLTNDDMYGGTPRYMAPEQAEFLRKGASHPDKKPGVPADIYALGAVLKELLDLSGLTPRPPSERSRGVLLRVLERCQETDPGRRFETASELAAALRDALDFCRLERALSPAAGPTRLLKPIGLALLAVLGFIPSVWGLGLVAGFFPEVTPGRIERELALFDQSGSYCVSAFFFCTTAALTAAVGIFWLGIKVRRAAAAGDLAQRRSVRKFILNAPLIVEFVGSAGAIGVLLLGWTRFHTGELPVRNNLFAKYIKFTNVGNALFVGAIFLACEHLSWTSWYRRLWEGEVDLARRVRNELSTVRLRSRLTHGVVIGLPILACIGAITHLFAAPVAAFLSFAGTMGFIGILSSYHLNTTIEALRAHAEQSSSEEI